MIAMEHANWPTAKGAIDDYESARAAGESKADLVTKAEAMVAALDTCVDGVEELVTDDLLMEFIGV